MSIYGAIIAEARKPENQIAEKISQKTRKVENQKTRKPDSRKASESKILTLNVKEEEVNLSIKVALRRRRYWMGQAKLKGETLTEVIIEALSKRYGEPKD